MSAIMRDMREDITCPSCGIVFTAPHSHRRKFCSKPCMYLGRTKSPDQLKATYRRSYAPEHPLRRDTPVVASHRILLWDKIGRGPHPCFYCGVTVSWFPDLDTESLELCVDHRDQDKYNNDLDNLVACCRICNMRNTPRVISEEEDFITRSDGSRLRAIRSRCLRCSVEFLAPIRTYKKTPRLYCSRACYHARNVPVSD